MLEFNMKTHADKALFRIIVSSGFSSYVTVHCLMLMMTTQTGPDWDPRVGLGGGQDPGSVSTPTALRPDWPACSSRCSS